MGLRKNRELRWESSAQSCSNSGHALLHALAALVTSCKVDGLNRVTGADLSGSQKAMIEEVASLRALFTGI